MSLTARGLLLALVIAAQACRTTTHGHSGGDSDVDGDSDGDGDGDGDGDPGEDNDHDGLTPDQGDCDDFEANINPNAFEVAANNRDDDCDGEIDEAGGGCDCGAASLPQGMDLCDERFLLSWEERYEAPDGGAADGVVARFGAETNGLAPRLGCAYTVLTTGYLDLDQCSAQECPDGARQPGHDFYAELDEWGYAQTYCGDDGTEEQDPSPDGGGDVIICDTHQLVLHLKAPANANGFSFDFVYMSAEYPEWVDLGYNDTFYAIIDRPAAGERENISFDNDGNEIEVDNAFFEDPPQTDLAGTGFDGQCTNEETYEDEVCGSSTGWLRTQWNVDPYEEFTLTLSIHDEGDGVWDSAVIIDNFAWSLNPVDPGTDLI